MTVVDDVKARTDIVEIIQSRVPLKKGGAQLQGELPIPYGEYAVIHRFS